MRDPPGSNRTQGTIPSIQGVHSMGHGKLIAETTANRHGHNGCVSGKNSIPRLGRKLRTEDSGHLLSRTATRLARTLAG